MNFILLGYIIAWIAVIWIALTLAFTIYEYSQLSNFAKRQIELKGGIDATKHIIVLVLSVVYIIVYHIS